VVDQTLPMNQRYTHYYEGAGAGRPKLTQRDYIFVSEALRHRITGYGFERRSIHGIDAVAAREGAEPITPFPTAPFERQSGRTGVDRSVAIRQHCAVARLNQ
jgi:hypothetical protein